MRRLRFLLLAAAVLITVGCGQSKTPALPTAHPTSPPALEVTSTPPPSGVPSAPTALTPEQLFQAFDTVAQSETQADGIGWFRRVAQQHSSNALAHILLGSLLEQDGEFAEARREVDRGIQLNGGPHPLALQVLGDLATDALEYDEALEYYKKAASMVPGDARLAARTEWSAAYVYLWRDGPARAREALDKAIASEPETAGMKMLSSALLLCDGKADEAIKTARALLAAHPDRIGPYFVVAQILCSTGQPAEAARLLGEGLEKFPDSPVMRTLQMRMQSMADPKAVTPAGAAALQMTAGAHPGLVTVWKSHFSVR